MSEQTQTNDLAATAAAVIAAGAAAAKAPTVIEAAAAKAATAAEAFDPGTLSRADLANYALSQFSLSFKSTATKAEILAALDNATAQGPVSKYRVRRRLRHDNKPYGIGAIVSLSAAAAAPLLRTHVVEPATETVPL